MKHNLPILLFLLGVLCSGQLRAQYLVSFQNNTALDYDFQVVQTGNISLSTSQYTVMDTLLTAYANGMEMLQFEPDTIMVPGDSVDFAGKLTNSNDTMIIQMRVVMDSLGPSVSYSGAGSGFDLSWFTDLNFHSAAFTMQGDPFTFKFKRITDLVDMDDDVLFAVQEDFIYSLDSADFGDPNSINVMAYNLQMTPVVSFDFLERATYFPPLISLYQDVVVIEELFDAPTRINVLTPGMVAAGFPYATTILNDTALSHITSPSNGGVIIYSRWPIETEAEIKYANCSNNNSFDCLASKGVKYARVNKLGKKYHIFGTHFEAGGSATDIQIRFEQYGEISDFIDSMAIPADEAVIFGGDLNTDPNDGIEYDSLRWKTNAIIPLHTGYFESTFSYADTGNIIDHVWGQADHLLPIESYNKIITFRSVDSVMWDIFDFSDHRTALGRFVYPDIQPDAFIDTALCFDDNLTMSVGSSDSLNFQWTLNGSDLIGANAASYTITNPSASDMGAYSCMVTNAQVYGGQGNALSGLFFPEGPDTLVQAFNFPLAVIGFQDPCGVGLDEIGLSGLGLVVVPNPSSGRFEIRMEDLTKYNTLELLNSVGQKISKNSVSGTSVQYDISYLDPGIYILRASGDNAGSSVKILVY